MPIGTSDPKRQFADPAAPIVCFAVAYNFLHHNSLFGTAKAISGTRLADWIDLLTPLCVVLPLMWFLKTQQAKTLRWLIACLGAIVYVEGHGIHLAANSIGNSGPVSANVADTVHLWDEVVGHYLWYGGLAALLFACASAAMPKMPDRSDGRQMWTMVAAGGISGITWATNGLEGGTPIFSWILAAAAVSTSASRRSKGLSAFLGVGGLVALVILTVYGIIHHGFPQPSSLN